MVINIPQKKARISKEKALRKAMAVYLDKKHCSNGDVHGKGYDILVEDEPIYYPYWVGMIHTKKDRALPIYPPKEIMYYVVCDARDRNFIVLRNVPKTNKIACEEAKTIPAFVREDEITGEIAKEAIKDRINRQFIFGPPKATVKDAEMIYLPMMKVNIKKKNSGEGKAFAVNSYTGEVKMIGKAYF